MGPWSDVLVSPPSRFLTVADGAHLWRQAVEVFGMLAFSAATPEPVERPQRSAGASSSSQSSLARSLLQAVRRPQPN